MSGAALLAILGFGAMIMVITTAMAYYFYKFSEMAE